MDGFLAEFEQMVLLAVVRLDEGAYGAAIRREVGHQTGRTVSHGASFVTLDRLERKGFLTSTMGSSTSGRGGRPKRFFRITPAGAAALKRTRAAFDRLWDGVDDMLETS